MPRPDAEDAPHLALETFLPYRLARAAEEVSQRFAAHYRARYGLTRPEWRTLATVGQFGRITAKAIGGHSSMHKTKVSRAVAALERRRWLARTTDPGDRRVEHITLTPEGRRHYAALVDVALAFERELVALIGPEATARLAEGLAAIEAMAAPAAGRPTPPLTGRNR